MRGTSGEEEPRWQQRCCPSPQEVLVGDWSLRRLPTVPRSGFNFWLVKAAANTSNCFQKKPSHIGSQSLHLPSLLRKIAIPFCELEFDSGVKGLLNMTGQRTCSQNLFLVVLAVVYFLKKHECFSLNNQLYLHEEKGNHFVKSFRFGLSKICLI